MFDRSSNCVWNYFPPKAFAVLKLELFAAFQNWVSVCVCMLVCVEAGGVLMNVFSGDNIKKYLKMISECVNGICNLSINL